MTMHIYAVGRINGGQVDIPLAPRRQQPVCSDSHAPNGHPHCFAYSHGYDDAKDGYLPEPLHHVSALCCIERYLMGHRDGLVALEMSRAQRAPGPAPDGSLQGMIDLGAETADYEDYLVDVEFFRHGC